MKEHSYQSSLREKLIEHLFVGEILKYSWINKNFSAEVSKPEVDNSGYDIIVEANGFIRHVQLKSTYLGGKAARQNIHLSLGNKQSGCVVWIYFNQESLELGPFYYFGGRAGESLPDITERKLAKHTKGDASGSKAERPNIRVLNKGDFTRYNTVEEVFGVLFSNGPVNAI